MAALAYHGKDSPGPVAAREHGPEPRHENAVLGAMLTGAIGLDDLDDTLVECFHYRVNRSLYLALYLMLRARRGHGRGVPLPVAIALAHTLTAPGPLGAGAIELRSLGSGWRDERGRVRWLGYIPRLAREAPRRREAIAAVEALRQREVHAWDLERDREAVRAAILEAAQEAALAFRRAIEDAGGLPYVAASEGYSEALRRRYEVRPIEPAALPTAREVMGWIGGAT